MRISDWSSDVCSSDLLRPKHRTVPVLDGCVSVDDRLVLLQLLVELLQRVVDAIASRVVSQELKQPGQLAGATGLESLRSVPQRWQIDRSEEHTSELQSLMRISYAVLCLKQTLLNTQRHNRC